MGLDATMVLYYGTLKNTMVLKFMYYGIYMVLQESHALP